MRPVRQRHRRRCARDFFDRDRVCEVGHPRAAVCFIHRHAEQTKITHVAPKCGWEQVVTINLRGHRFQVCLRPRVHHVTQGVHIVTKIKGHRGSKHGISKFIERLFNNMPYGGSRVNPADPKLGAIWRRRCFG